jgi:hypothetical protein
MAEIKVDTVKMRESGNDMMQISLEIGEEFDLFFEKIANMPIKTYEWTGKAAEAFSQRANREKPQYMRLKDDLYKRGKYLVDYANYLESNIESLRR